MADSIADVYGDDWYENIPALSSYKGRQANKEVEHLRKAKEKLDDASRPYNHDNIVAATTLGFWHGLLKQEYESKLYAPLFASFFQVTDREEAYKKVNQIKRLRNNVAHYEAILVFPDNKKLRELYKDYKLILKMIRWICPETAGWVENHSSAQFFAAWNCCPEFISGALKLGADSSEDEGNSNKWTWFSQTGPLS